MKLSKKICHYRNLLADRNDKDENFRIFVYVHNKPYDHLNLPKLDYYDFGCAISLTTNEFYLNIGLFS